MPEDQHSVGKVVYDQPMPMRDGVLLRGNIFYPKGEGPWPVLLQRTPYGKAAVGNARFIAAGYVVVSQDIRGRYASDGDWIPFSEPDTPDGPDGHDTIEWIAAEDWCDGNVGTFGASYDAWLQWQAARHRPAHLRAMCAYTIPMELTDLDYPGAFRLARRLHWWFATMAPDVRKRDGWPAPHMPSEGRRMWAEIEQGMRLGTLPVGAVSRALPPSLAKYVEAFLRDPARKPWRFAEAHGEIDVPNLDFTGWFDHCFSADHVASMQKQARTEDARTQTRVMIGPSYHSSHGEREVGGYDFGENAGFDKEGMMIEWFDHWLKGIDNDVRDQPAVKYFVLGSGTWKTAPTWPPPEIGKALTLHLSCDGQLREAVGDGGADEYTYDPMDPTPTVWEQGVVQLPYDRARLGDRRDMVTYCTAPLEADVEIVGHAAVTLFAASTAPDTDFFAHLCDVAPDGSAMEITHGMVRARHRNGLDQNDPITPGEVVEYTITLRSTACRFRAGHRIRLDIASANFPHYDRNHNTGGDDLFEAEMRVAEQTVYHDAARASRVVMGLNG